jgi:hypothetical protein
MGRIVTFELCLSDTAVRVVNSYQVDVVRVASEAVFECLRAKIESEQALKLDSEAELRERLKILEAIIMDVQSEMLARAMCKV